MCLILIGFRVSAEMPLVIAANRDETHDRASREVHFWPDHPNVLAGRDEVAGGTWLGCHINGRFAALTNFASPEEGPKSSSRGRLVEGFLTNTVEAASYAEQIKGDEYAGFNLLLWDGETLLCTSNKGPTVSLAPGFYGLSNTTFDNTPLFAETTLDLRDGERWPKCVNGATHLANLCQQQFTTADLIALLANRSVPDDEFLPRRGRPLEFERRVAPCFIVGDEYGTRASSALIFSPDVIQFEEQRYLAGGARADRVSYSVPLLAK